MKEIDPVGGGARQQHPPGSANVRVSFVFQMLNKSYTLKRGETSLFPRQQQWCDTLCMSCTRSWIRDKRKEHLRDTHTHTLIHTHQQTNQDKIRSGQLHQPLCR